MKFYGHNLKCLPKMKKKKVLSYTRARKGTNLFLRKGKVTSVTEAETSKR